jgi:hypothetical protein
MSFPDRWLIGLLILFQIPHGSAGRKNPSSSAERDVCSYYEERVAFLLGCCGDVELGYSGPRFPRFDNRKDRAAAALKEIGIALKQCSNYQSAEHASLLLDRVGADIELSNRLIDSGEYPSSLAAVHQAANHAERAVEQLSIIINSYPKVVSNLWPWIAESFVKAGRPFEALSFLNSLHPSSSDQATFRKMRGDVNFALSAYASAADDYSHWAASTHRSPCRDGISDANIAYLQNRGFKIATSMTEPSQQSVCFGGDDWHPYLRLSQEHLR